MDAPAPAPAPDAATSAALSASDARFVRAFAHVDAAFEDIVETGATFGEGLAILAEAARKVKTDHGDSDDLIQFRDAAKTIGATLSKLQARYNPLRDTPDARAAWTAAHEEEEKAASPAPEPEPASEKADASFVRAFLAIDDKLEVLAESGAPFEDGIAAVAESAREAEQVAKELNDEKLLGEMKAFADAAARVHQMLQAQGERYNTVKDTPSARTALDDQRVKRIKQAEEAYALERAAKQ